MNAVAVNGKTITQCFELVSRVSKEIDGLNEKLPEMIVNAFNETPLLPCTLADTQKYISRLDDYGWLYTDAAYSFPIKDKGKGKRNTKGYIGFQISLMGDGIAILGNNEPLLHVFLWRDPISFKDDYYTTFPFFDDNTNDEYIPLKVINDRLLLWSNEGLDWKQCEWTYSLRLMALNSQEDLKKHVIDPMILLLRGEDVMTALPDSLPALVKYPVKEKLIYQE
jgi:hypothetical protein